MSEEELVTCEREGCDVQFIKRKHNQIYHDNDCCQQATNANTKAKYYARRAQRLGIPRYCTSCNIKLSRYNPDSMCNSCQSIHTADTTDAVAKLFANIV